MIKIVALIWSFGILFLYGIGENLAHAQERESSLEEECQTRPNTKKCKQYRLKTSKKEKDMAAFCDAYPADCSTIAVSGGSVNQKIKTPREKKKN